MTASISATSSSCGSGGRPIRCFGRSCSRSIEVGARDTDHLCDGLHREPAFGEPETLSAMGRNALEAASSLAWPAKVERAIKLYSLICKTKTSSAEEIDARARVKRA